MKEYECGPINKEHKARFEALRDPEFNNFALMSCKLDNIETSVICAITQDNKEYLITPLFLTVNESIMQRLKDPSGETPRKL